LRHFILFMSRFPEIGRQEIDRGTLNREALGVVNCVRSSLFNSYGLRRDSNLILCPVDQGNKLIRIEGEKLRYMGPNERSISILLSMSANKLFSRSVTQDEVSSPGITILRKDLLSSIGGKEDSLSLYQSQEGLDLRMIKFTERTIFISALNPEISLQEIISMFRLDPSTPLRVRADYEAEKMILLINNEIDRQHAQSIRSTDDMIKQT
jgi:tRNA pseudouridine-54 N-methylase